MKFPPARLLVVLLATSLAGCVPRMYAGPRRPDSQLTIIEMEGTVAREIDGAAAPRTSKLALLPGLHRVLVAPSDTANAYSRHGHPVSRVPQTVCFEGSPGHVYLLRPAYLGDIWQPELIDVNGARKIQPIKVGVSVLSCSTTEPLPAPVAAAPPVPVTPISAPPTGPGPRVRLDVAAGTPAPVASTAPAVQASGAPRRPVALPGVPAVPPPPPRATRAGNSIGVDLGIALGGDEESETSAGDTSLLFGVSGSMTPIWAGDRLGFGVAMGMALKYDALGGSNGHRSTTRLPFNFLLQAVVPMDADWFVALRGGVQKDVGAVTESPWGARGELAFGRMYLRYQFGFAVHFTRITYTVGGTTLDGSNVGLLGTLAFLP